mgnify:CR=1 FL=1
MKRLLPLAALALSGCEKVEMLGVDVRSDREIVIRVSSGRCLDDLEIGTPDIHSTVLWRIERDHGVSAPCPRDFVFPRVPKGYRAVITADRLPVGQYAIFGMAGDYAVAGNFDLRPR